MDTDGSRGDKRTRSDDSGDIWTATWQHKRYLIAWICEPSVLTPASLMLDRIHEDLIPRPSDSNSYILGNIGRHNIVITSAPPSEKPTAGPVALALRRTFPSIQIAMMMGTGGGVPGSLNMHLGDVAVGYCVMPGDFWRWGPSMHCKAGIPIIPERRSEKVISELKKIHESKGNKIQSILDKVWEEYPNWAREYKEPPPEYQLFRVKESKFYTWVYAKCDTVTITRSRKNVVPKVHYGIIGCCGSKVENVAIRDELAVTLEHRYRFPEKRVEREPDLNVICIKEGAAGWNDICIPWLAIQGISNYLDGCDNAQWEGYASARVAACAKELVMEAVVLPF
ncbi:hypothetical protein TrVFT333_002131 [Trichoderma virens FT-333]|nr:hypothetical protein TrVFT333_002131 [Trichoderma virens FT-333]